MSKRTIDLGYIHMSSWTPRSRLGDDYVFDPDDECYNDESSKAIRKLKPEQVVLKEGIYTLKITYPLHQPYTRMVTVREAGMTRRRLVNLIVMSYKAIYATAEDDNPYGIWGHCMSDLMLHTAEVTPASRGAVDCDKGTITVRCDS